MSYTGIELLQTTFAGAIHNGVFCRKAVITKGTKFGPFKGKQVNTSEIKTNDDNSFMWEVRTYVYCIVVYFYVYNCNLIDNGVMNMVFYFITK